MKFSIQVSVILSILTFAFSAQSLSLDQYLSQVRRSNNGLRGAQTSQSGDQNAVVESILPFSPQFFANYQHSDDQRQTLVPVFEGTRNIIDQEQMGVSKLFDFGLESKLYYSVDTETYFGIDPRYVALNPTVMSGFTVQLTQHLWQNGFGASDRAAARATKAQDLANAYTNAYQVKTTLAEAEIRYWTLAMDRELVKVQKQSVARTNAIRDFDKRRARAHLIDESDLLASDAQAKEKEYELQVALNNEKKSARAFNTARGVYSDEVTDQLDFPPPEEIEKIKPVQPAKFRDDVKAAKQSEIAAEAGDESAIQKQKPALDLVGSFSTNGLEAEMQPSIQDTFSNRYPYYTIGVNFTAPLEFGAVAAVKRAYATQKVGAELSYRERLFEQSAGWKDLIDQLNEAKQQLSLAVDVERAQKLKFEHERLRQKHGASTTYQVFQYELDYLNAQISRISTESQILDLVAQMKTFGGES